MDDQLPGTPTRGIDRRTLLRGAAMLGAAAWVAGCGGSEGAAVRVSRGAPQAFELGRWRSRARLMSSRVEAALVSHGERIHVLGGATMETGAVARHEAYVPGDDGWRVLAPLPGPAAGAGAATGQGRIYVVGGIDEAGRPLAEAHAYDSAANVWTALPPLPRAAAAPSLVVVEDLLVALSGRRVWVLSAGDLGAATWMEGARAPVPRSRPAAVALANVVHVIGGREGRQPSNRHDVYNPWSDEWFDLARSRPRAAPPPRRCSGGRRSSPAASAGTASATARRPTTGARTCGRRSRRCRRRAGVPARRCSAGRSTSPAAVGASPAPATTSSRSDGERHRRHDLPCAPAAPPR